MHGGAYPTACVRFLLPLTSTAHTTGSSTPSEPRRGPSKCDRAFDTRGEGSQDAEGGKAAELPGTTAVKARLPAKDLADQRSTCHGEPSVPNRLCVATGAAASTKGTTALSSSHLCCDWHSHTSRCTL